MRLIKNIPAFQPAFNVLPRGHVPVALRSVTKIEDGGVLRSEFVLNLSGRPCVKLTLALFRLATLHEAVGIECGIKAPIRTAHLTQGEIQDVVRYAGVKLLMRDLVGLGVDRRKLRLVVKHFFEMWHAPKGICGIAMETAADVVVNSSRRHGTQRPQSHIERILVPAASPVA